jgi:hypothetical protein
MATHKRRKAARPAEAQPPETSPQALALQLPPVPFQFRDPRQQRIYDRLSSLVAAGPARFWRDACAIMEGETGVVLDSASHIVGHLLREIESAIRDVLEQLVPSTSWPSRELDKAHFGEISAILAALDVDPEKESWAKIWLSTSTRAGAFRLDQIAHRKSLELPRPVDSEFRRLWDQMGDIFDVVLDRFETKYLKVFEALDRLLKKPKPTNSDLEELKLHIPNNYVARSYFFEKLRYGDWLLPLKSYGFFDDPPGRERDQETDRWVSPMWPQLRYLARMAEVIPQAIHEIVMGMPDTDNASVNADLAEAATAKAMPAPLAADLSPRVLAWIESAAGLFDPERLSAFIVRLAGEGQAQAGLRVAQSLLALEADPHATAAAAQGKLYLSPGPQARLSEAEYQAVARSCIPALVKSAAMPTLEWLSTLLDDAISLSQRPDATDAWDMSRWWRPAIESDAGSISYALPNFLTSTIRDAAIEIGTAHPEEIAPTIDLLEKHPRHVFYRLVLHLLRILPSSPKDLIIARLTERDRFFTEGVWRETALLMREHFRDLSTADQARILSWIDEGPRFEKAAPSTVQGLVSPPTDEEKVHATREWQLRRLEPIREALPAEWRRRYEALVSEMGESKQFELPKRGMEEATWVGPTSEITADELRDSTVEAIVDRLRIRPPGGPPSGHSPHGLARELTSVVAADPERFAMDSNQFRGLDPTYVRGLLFGLTQAAKQKRQFSWTPVLSLCQWVVSQPRELPERQSEHPELDTGWGWTRKTVAGLLSAGFEVGPSEIPFDLRKSSWDVLGILAEDPEPTLQDEVHDERMDPVTHSINTVRGEALHAIIRYAVWVRRYLSTDAGQRGRTIGLEKMREVAQVLVKHLDPTHERTLTIRSIYGMWFTQLTWLDRKWTKKHASRIFPRSDRQRRLRDAAWEAYIAFSEAYGLAFGILRSEYRRSVEEINQIDPNRPRPFPTSPAGRLCEHLMVLYWQGEIAFEDPDRLLDLFFEKAPDQLRGYAIESIGRWLRHSPSSVPPEVLERLSALWTRRLSAAQSASVPSAHSNELAAFGWWFSSGKFEDRWALTQMGNVLVLIGKIEPMMYVMERLADLADDLTPTALNLLKLIIKGDKRGFVILTRREPVRVILAKAIRHPDPARRQATDLINSLSTRGHLEFADLLSST